MGNAKRNIEILKEELKSILTLVEFTLKLTHEISRLNET